MPCRTTTSTWITNIKIGLDSERYVVELKRFPSCCNVHYQLFVNGREIQDHGLFCNCGHLSSSGGSYEWEDKGHHFHLMFDGLPSRKVNKYFRLFVDGIDVDTGFEFTIFWRRKGIQLFAAGSVLIFLVAFIYILVFVVFGVDPKHLGSMAGLNMPLCFGVMYVVIALVIFKKYTQRRSYVQCQSFRDI